MKTYTNEEIRKLSVWKRCINELPTEAIECEFIVKTICEYVTSFQYFQHLGCYMPDEKIFVSNDDGLTYSAITQCLNTDDDAYVEMWIEFERAKAPNYITICNL